MAEFAQRGIEEMLVELEKMRKLGIFNSDEVRAIMKKRKRFEYKLQRRTKEKENYLQYINYEVGLIRLIKMRREKNGIELGKEEIEKEIYLRVCKLFRIVCFRFKSDVKLWMTYIDFLKKFNDKIRVSKIFTTMLKIHNRKPNIWILAAKFEFEDNESIETARSLFQRALRFLPHSPKIWLEYFRMELLCVELIMKRRELLKVNEMEDDKDDEDVNDKKDEQTDVDKSREDAILSCKIVEIVYKRALKELKENLPQLISSFISIASHFKFTKNLIDQMYKTIEEDETLNAMEETWDVLARRHLLDERDILEQCAKTGQVADFTIAGLEEQANEAFKAVLTSARLNTLKMHQLYADFLIERLRLDSKFLNDERFERLESALKQMEQQFGEIPLNYLFEWIEFKIKFKKHSEARDLCEKYLKSHGTSKELWTLTLRAKLDESTTAAKDEPAVFELFKRAATSLKEKDTLDAWRLVIAWYVNNKCGTIEKLFELGAQVMTKKVAEFIRAEYLAWAGNNGGIKKTRAVFEKFRQMPPFSIHFFRKYIELERTQTPSDSSRVSRAYETALEHFGKFDTDIWLEYIEYTYSLGSNRTDVITSVYERAMRTLDPTLIEQFVQKFCVLKMNINANNNNNNNHQEKKPAIGSKQQQSSKTQQQASSSSDSTNKLFYIKTK